MTLENMRDVLKRTLGRSLQTLPDEDRLAAAWPVVCGRALAEHGTVAGYADGIVWVQVRDETWRQQFMAMHGQLASEMGRVAGVKVTAIHWEVKRNKTI
jgi:hypothetical protein